MEQTSSFPSGPLSVWFISQLLSVLIFSSPAFSVTPFWPFRSEREKMGRRPVVFIVTCTTHHLFCHFPWIDFRQSFHQHASPGVGSRHTVSHSRKISLKGSNFPKNRLFQGTKGYPVCAQPTGHGKCSKTPTLFPSPRGHPTDLSFLGDFC